LKVFQGSGKTLLVKALAKLLRRAAFSRIQFTSI
jgi:MoxR-like ATPase